jgi:hypothetical protein
VGPRRQGVCGDLDPHSRRGWFMGSPMPFRSLPQPRLDPECEQDESSGDWTDEQHAQRERADKPIVGAHQQTNGSEKNERPKKARPPRMHGQHEHRAPFCHSRREQGSDFGSTFAPDHPGGDRSRSPHQHDPPRLIEPPERVVGHLLGVAVGVGGEAGVAAPQGVGRSRIGRGRVILRRSLRQPGHELQAL